MTSAMATIIGAVISATAAIAVCVITSNAQHKKLMSELEKQNTLQDYRLKQLEAKVDQHNKLDRRIVALEEQIKSLTRTNTMHGG